MLILQCYFPMVLNFCKLFPIFNPSPLSKFLPRLKTLGILYHSTEDLNFEDFIVLVFVLIPVLSFQVLNPVSSLNMLIYVYFFPQLIPVYFLLVLICFYYFLVLIHQCLFHAVVNF